jgi:hypothetical protein
MVHASELPPDSLLLPYRGVGYTDCYVTELPFPVTAAEFIEAFYTSSLFKLERMILSAVLRRASTDAQAHELAIGHRHSFAAWSVEARKEGQVLLAAGRTRSWLAITPDKSSGTQLYFGSAVVPRHSASGAHTMGLWFWALSGFHKAYSRALLRAARNRLLARSRAGSFPNEPV